MAIKNFLGIPKISLKKAKIVVIPFGLEKTTSYGKGTKNGPQAIINASQQVELFDEELWQETYKKINITTLDIKESLNNLKKKINFLLKNKKIPIVLGGEHTITSFLLPIYKKHFKSLSIIQFDAHADLRDSYLNQKYSHATTMRRCLEINDVNLVQVGIRNISKEEDELFFWKKNKKIIRTFWAKDMERWKTKEIIDFLNENVYLTFDIDAFDCSLMPATGTPEPGGLDWYKATKILKGVIFKKRIVGVDVVELAPIRNFSAPDFLTAKLIYKIIGYISKRNEK